MPRLRDCRDRRTPADRLAPFVLSSALSSLPLHPQTNEKVRSLDRSRTLFKQMEANDWHSFSASAPNWGYASFLKRSDAYFNNVRFFF